MLQNTHLPARLLICPLVRSFTHLFAHLPGCSLTCPLVCSFSHSLTHLSAHGARGGGGGSGGGGSGGGGDGDDPASIHVSETILQPHVRERKEREKPSLSLGEEHEIKIFIAPKLLKLERFGFHQQIEETLFYLRG